jgi:hypothetical protein
VGDVSRARRPLAVAAALWPWGFDTVALPMFVVSARHHFVWVKKQAEPNAAWWDRGVS